MGGQQSEGRRQQEAALTAKARQKEMGDGVVGVAEASMQQGQVSSIGPGSRGRGSTEQVCAAGGWWW